MKSKLYQKTRDRLNFILDTNSNHQKQLVCDNILMSIEKLEKLIIVKDKRIISLEDRQVQILERIETFLKGGV